MTTIKDLVRECLEETGEASDTLDCYYQANHAERRAHSERPPVHPSTFDALPDDDFDAGYGGTNGPAFIAFTDKYVYISSEYDGAEGVTAIPRHPERIGGLIPRV